MPTRLLKDSIHQSERLNKLSDFQYRVWVNLITYVDDFGRGDARPAIIKGTCFPLRERLSNADIEAALQALAGAGCVGLYEVGGKPYLYFPRWESHQNIRNKKSKYPAPPQSDDDCTELNTNESNCIQTPANVPVIQSESISESNTESNPDICTEPRGVPVLSILLNDKSEYEIYQVDVDEWQELYQAVDVMQELRKMKGWCKDNPTRRKTRNGIRRFINSWLAKVQDRGGSSPYLPHQQTGQSKTADSLHQSYDMMAGWAAKGESEGGGD